MTAITLREIDTILNDNIELRNLFLCTLYSVYEGDSATFATSALSGVQSLTDKNPRIRTTLALKMWLEAEQNKTRPIP